VSLPGKNYAGYGEFLDENFIQMLENFSSPSSGGLPTSGKLGNPLEGQLWWDSTNLSLKVYNGTGWKAAGSTTSSATAPTSPNVGDLWWNTTNDQLEAWDGATWIVIGPSSISGTGVQATTIAAAGGPYPVITFTISNNVIAILSQSAAFTPSAAITGWGAGGLQQVKPGLNLSTASSYFFQGEATFAQSAEYADLAERFAADVEYEPGTVVEIGGSAEITKCTQELSENVLGVISTKAAYLMNAAAGSDATHPPVAMTGRVPVKVVGQVRKGDRLVSAGNGHARSATAGEATSFNVIGRALADSDSGTVEAVVTIK
jgi:hypothetical protein